LWSKILDPLSNPSFPLEVFFLPRCDKSKIQKELKIVILIITLLGFAPFALWFSLLRMGFSYTK